MQWKGLKSAQNGSLLLKSTPNLELLVNQFNNATPKVNVTVKYSSKYYDIDEMHNVEILNKNKSLFLFHINACSRNKIFNDHQHLLCCTKSNFDIIGVTETRITTKVSLLNNSNLNNYSYEFTPTKATAGGTLLYIANHISCKCFNDLDIYNKNELESTFLKLATLENQIL